MEHAQLQQVKAEYIGLAEYFMRPIPDRTLLAYADDLNDLRYEDVVGAMRNLRRQPGRRTLPLPGDIRALCENGGGDITARANDIAGRITYCMRRYGYTNPVPARQAIGEIGWQVVERRGGWTHICQTQSADQIGTFTAQCRDMAKSLMSLPSFEPLGKLLGTGASNDPEPMPRGMLSLGEVLKKVASR